MYKNEDEEQLYLSEKPVNGNGILDTKKIDRIRKDAHDKNNGETHWN